MRDLTGLVVVMVVALASAIAVLANSNLAVVIPAAAVAVTAAALLLLGIVEKTQWPTNIAYPSALGDPSGIRSTLAAGPRGRFPLVLLLDSLDRQVGVPDVHGPSQEEIKQLEAMPPDAWHRYLDQRLQEIERRT